MGWEQRGRRSYYYTAERVGGRVVKRYAGTGAVAGLAAQLDDINRQEREDERDARDAERAGLDALAAGLAPLNELADLLARAALLAAGFRRHHRGEWRRRREQA